MNKENWSNVDKVIQRYRFDLLKNMLKCDKAFWDTITAIKIIARNYQSYEKDKKNTYIRIIYVHYTDSYNLNDYCHHEESETDDIPIISKETRLEFGYYNGKFFIEGKTPIKVYSKRDNSKQPVTYSDTYEHELDEYTQSILLDEYADNKNIPEWLLITFFKSIKTDIEKVINEMSFE